MKKLIVAILILTFVTPSFGAWVSPTGHSDPNSKWSNETRAYDGNLVSNTNVALATANSYLELTHTGVSDCNQVKIYFFGQYPNATIDVNYSDSWNNIYAGTVEKGLNIFPIGSSQTVLAVRFATTTSQNPKINEVLFYTPSTSNPTKITNVSPTDANTGQEIKSVLTWTLGSLLDTDNYAVYLGTDNPPTSLVNGEAKAISAVSPLVETYDPLGVPPSTTYYWRIDAVSDYNTTAGDIWSFTTRNSYKVFMP